MIDKLPDLPLELINTFLSYNDRFNLRRTCKRLKYLVDSQVYRNLYVFLDCYPLRHRLFHSDELIYYADSCRIIKFDDFLSSRSKKRFKRIRKLVIYHDDFKFIFTELDRLVIDLEGLNYFEELEYLEIGTVGGALGTLRLKNLKVFSITITGTMPFKMNCEQLKVLRVSGLARPNFLCPNNQLTHLSLKLHTLGDMPRYFPTLLRQCQNITSLSSEFVSLLKQTLALVNAGYLKMPNLKVIQFERPQYFKEMNEEMIELLAAQERRIKPEKLQIVFNGVRLTLPQFIPIARLHKHFHNPHYENEEFFVFENDRLNHLYFRFLKANDPLASLDWLFGAIKAMPFELLSTRLDENLVSKLRNLEIINLNFSGRRISKPLFKRMLRTWTELLSLNIARPLDSIGQAGLDMMPDFWQNLNVLALCERPEDFGFVLRFKNLKGLCFCFNLERDELVFFLNNCCSLEILSFANPSTGFKTDLVTKLFGRYEHITQERYQLWHGTKYWGLDSDFRRKFGTLDQLVSFYYERDFFNQREINSFVKKFKNLFKYRD